MNNIVSAIFAVYAAAFIYSSTMLVKVLTVASSSNSALFWNHFAIFAVLFAAAYFVLAKYVAAFGAHISLVLGVICLLGLLIAIFTHLIPVDAVYQLPSFLSTFFGSSAAYTAWLVAPLVVLFF